jgi:hypothetical protein
MFENCNLCIDIRYLNKPVFRFFAASNFFCGKGLTANFCGG